MIKLCAVTSQLIAKIGAVYTMPTIFMELDFVSIKCPCHKSCNHRCTCYVHCTVLNDKDENKDIFIINSSKKVWNYFLVGYYLETNLILCFK